MKSFLNITKALSDETRVRILMTLTGGELCLCQVIEVMQLAPSTTSKHLTILYNAGLVERRKQGRFHYYRLADRTAPVEVRNILKCTLQAIGEDPVIAADQEKLAKVIKTDTEILCECYNK